MKSATSRVTQARLDKALADIRQYLTGSKDWQAALRQLSSIKDFSMGEVQLCSAQQALDHCAQVRGYFPPEVPESVRVNFDGIAREIREIQEIDAPRYRRLPWRLLLLVAIIVALASWYLFA